MWNFICIGTVSRGKVKENIILNLRSNFLFLIMYSFYSTDERITEQILKAMQTLATLSGHLELQTPRDAFITAICRASLPPNYSLTILSTLLSMMVAGELFVIINSIFLFQIISLEMVIIFLMANHRIL